MSAQPEQQVGQFIKRAVQGRWGKSSAPVLAANSFTMQANGVGDGPVENFVLTVGHVSPPPMLGTTEEQIAQLESLDSIEVQILGQFSIPHHQVRELARIFAGAVRTLDELKAEGKA